MLEAWVAARVRARLEAARTERWNIWHAAALTAVGTVAGVKALPSLKTFVGPEPGAPEREPASRPQSPDELLSVARRWAARGVGTITKH